jgi:hypothetical protein
MVGGIVYGIGLIILYIYTQIYTLWFFEIVMENGPFI